MVINHGEYGHDIVCAGASAVLFGSVNAIMGLTSEKPDINYEDDGGYFHIRVLIRITKSSINSSSNVSFFTNYRRRI